MQIVYSDESNKLTPEMKALMEKAADIALEREFGAELGAAGFSAADAAAELGVTVTDDDEIRALNCEYRGIDRVTDVLSFPQYEGHDELLDELLRNMEEAEDRDEDETIPPVTLLGDVVICYEQAERQAEEYGTGLRREMLYLFVHSIMHLFGYDHMEEEEKAVMRAREEEVLAAAGIVR